MKIREIIKTVLISSALALTIAQTIDIYGNKSYDLDEYYSIILTNNLEHSPIDQNLINIDLGNPPLYFIVLKLWLNLSGTNELEARSLSIVFFILSFLIFRKILSILKIDENLNIFISLIFLGINFLNPIIIYLRPYTLLYLLIVITIYLTFILDKNKPITKLLLIANIIFGFLTHYIYSIFFFFWLITNFIHNGKTIKEKLRDNLPLILGGIISSPIILNLINRELINVKPYHYVFWQTSTDWPGNAMWLSHLTKINYFASLNNTMSSIFWIVFLLLLCGLLIYNKKITNKEKTILSFLCFAWPTYLFSSLHNYLSSEKYFDFISIFFVLCFLVFLKLKNIKQQNIKLMTVFATIWLFLPNKINFYTTVMKEDWKEAALQLNSYEDPIVISSCDYKKILDFYLKNKKIYLLSEKQYNWCELEILKEETKKFVHISRADSDVPKKYRLDQKLKLEGINLFYYFK